MGARVYMVSLALSRQSTAYHLVERRWWVHGNSTPAVSRKSVEGSSCTQSYSSVSKEDVREVELGFIHAGAAILSYCTAVPASSLAPLVLIQLQVR